MTGQQNNSFNEIKASDKSNTRAPVNSA